MKTSHSVILASGAFSSTGIALLFSTLIFFITHVSTGAQVSVLPGGKFVTVNGMRMYYETHGEGPPLLLLHGFKGSSQLWKPFIGEMSKHYSLILPDLRGHGRTTNPTKKFTHKLAASDIQALLDQIRIRRCRALGLSSGGIILLHMATQRPDRIEAMVLVSASTHFPDEARVIMRKTSVENISPEEWEGARQLHVYGDEQILLLRQQFHGFKDSYDDVNFTPPYLGRIRAATLIVHGDRDPFFPVSIGVGLYRSIPHSYLWVIPNGEHVPIYQENAQFTRTSLEFFKSQTAE